MSEKCRFSKWPLFIIASQWKNSQKALLHNLSSFFTSRKNGCGSHWSVRGKTEIWVSQLLQRNNGAITSLSLESKEINDPLDLLVYLNHLPFENRFSVLHLYEILSAYSLRITNLPLFPHQLNWNITFIFLTFFIVTLLQFIFWNSYYSLFFQNLFSSYVVSPALIISFTMKSNL